MALVMYALQFVKSTLSRVEEDFNLMIRAEGVRTSMLVMSCGVGRAHERDFLRDFQVDMR